MSKKDDYLGHARALRRQGTGYQIHGWRDNPVALQKWMQASANVLQQLSDGYTPVPKVDSAVRQIKRRRRPDILTFVQDVFDPADHVKPTIDALVNALEEVTEGAGDRPLSEHEKYRVFMGLPVRKR